MIYVENTCELLSRVVSDGVFCTVAILYGLYHCSSIRIIIHTYILCTIPHKSILCSSLCVCVCVFTRNDGLSDTYAL